MRKGDDGDPLEVCHLLNFFLLSSIHSEFQLLYFETKAVLALVLRMYYISTQDFIINVFVSLVCTGFYNKDLPFQN